jgi:hypothetical protein
LRRAGFVMGAEKRGLQKGRVCGLVDFGASRIPFSAFNLCLNHGEFSKVYEFIPEHKIVIGNK